MAAPPIPPRPFDDYDEYLSHYSSSPPPAVPPLPPGFSQVGPTMSAPHFEDPLVAPRPHKLQPDLPANMARSLDEQLAQSPIVDQYHRGRSPALPPNPVPGFVMPHRSHSRGPSPHPPQQGAEWNAWAPVAASQPSPPVPRMPQQYSSPPQQFPQNHRMMPPHNDSLSASFSAMSVSDTHRPVRSASTYSTYGPQPPPPQQPANTSAPPSLTAPLPTIPSLLAQLPSVQQPNFDPSFKVAWCRQVLALVDRAQQLTLPDSTATEFPSGPARIDDTELQRLVDIGLPLLVRLSSSSPSQAPKPSYVAEAIYLLATCEASGAYPQYVQRDPRSAFRHFEQAAKAGHYTAWFRLGRDYENFNDIEHARQCFERGVKRGVESCIYRMGMANLMGQLGLPANPEAALPLLHRAATLASIEVPQPAYVYGLLLLGEFSHVTIPPEFFDSYIPQGSNLQTEARKHLERAAYLNFAPAQYKLGHAYEFAMPPFPFDALLSVQYYSLASQQGEVEADMALSKWFLCGSEGAFERDEGLAWTFADKAARKGLPSAEFAMGYYAEVGVGGPKDIDVARKWYAKAAQHGNADAAERLRALSQPLPNTLSREQHETLADTTIVRKRTLARQRSDARRGVAGARIAVTPASQGQQIISNVRRSSEMGSRIPVGLPSAPNAVGHGAPNARPMPPSSSAPQINGSEGYDSATVGHYSPGSSAHLHPVSSPAPIGSTQSPRAFANAPRYSLVDPGSRPMSPANRPGPGAPPMRTQSRQNRPGGAPLNDTAQIPEVDREQEAPAPPKARAPQTFEEMGITPAKLEEKECLIM